jgi:hypothetical protein
VSGITSHFTDLPTFRMPLLLRRLICFALLIVTLPLAAQSTARDYTARVPLTSNTQAARDAAMVTALETVYDRASGLALPQELRGEAQDWAQHFGLARDDEGLWLQVAFDPAAIDHAVRSRGAPLWGRENTEAEWVYLQVEGLGGSHDYAWLIDSLGRDERIQTRTLERIEGSRLTLRLLTRGGRATLDQLMRDAGFIAQRDGGPGSVLDYRMR